MLRRRVVGYLLAYLAIALLLALAVLADLDVLAMLRDPQAQTDRIDTEPWIGWLSMVGVMLWAAAAGCCWIAAWASRTAGQREDSQFLAATGLLSGLLALDDGLVGHDHLVPWLLDGRGERLAMVALGLVALTWFVAFRRRLLTPSHFQVWLFGGCFAASAGIDMFIQEQSLALQVAEDGFKLAGIVTFADAARVWSQRALGDALDLQRHAE